MLGLEQLLLTLLPCFHLVEMCISVHALRCSGSVIFWSLSILFLCQQSTPAKQIILCKRFFGRRQWTCDHSKPLKPQLWVFTSINLPKGYLNKNKYLEKRLLINHTWDQWPHLFALNWTSTGWRLGFVGGSRSKKKNKTPVWVVGVSQRDHVLDPEEQSNRDKGGCWGDNTEAVPCRPHAT